MGLFRRGGLELTSDGWLLPRDAEPAMNDGPGTFSYNVVGESHHNANLRRILRDAGMETGDGGEHFTQCFLLCEPKNQHDPNAVAVVIDGKRVGYIPRVDAEELAPQLQGLAKAGQVLCVQARIGWSDPAIIGVQLDLDFD